MVEFAGWQMPIQYTEGIIAEHLTTRKAGGLFDVSHMGRFRLTGAGAPGFLRRVLTNDCDKLAVGRAHYTILANEAGGAIDDAFLYRPAADEFLLVVNASNKDKDWAHLQEQAAGFSDVALADVSDEVAMLALQGPESDTILQSIVTEGSLPQAKRNAVGNVKIGDAEVCVARTGYTGEPVCFELFIPAVSASEVWDGLMQAGASPVGLGARDTLRLEAGLPLYGHELGVGPDGEIPIYAIPQARFAVSLDDAGRDFIGREAIEAQVQAKERYKGGDFSDIAALPKVVRQMRLVDKGIARDGAVVYYQDRPVGWVTSGTMVPYWELKDEHGQAELDRGTQWKDVFTGIHLQRAVGLCMIAPDVGVGAEVEVEVRGRRLKAIIVERNLENRKGNTANAVL